MKSWDEIKTLLTIIDFARDHGPQLKVLHDAALQELVDLQAAMVKPEEAASGEGHTE